MINWLFVNFLRDDANPPLPTQQTALALLSSVVADGDVITDWLYYNESTKSEEDITEWLITLQLITCICGTLSWLGVATDGRLVSWLRSAVYLILMLLAYIVWIPLHTIAELWDWIFMNSHMYTCLCKCFYSFHDSVRWIRYNVIPSLWHEAKRKPTFSSGTVLFFGILVEDIPQLIVTFLIEEKIKSDDPKGRISNAALINLLFAIFDIMHKLAQAYDLRTDVHNVAHNAAYLVKRTIRAHGKWITSLTMASVNYVLSTCGDSTAKVWDVMTGKCIRAFESQSEVLDAVVVLGTSKVLLACKYAINIFNFETGALEYTLELEFNPDFVSLSPDFGSFLTGKGAWAGVTYSSLQRWDLPAGGVPQLLTTYKGTGATSITFLDNDTFVSHHDKISSTLSSNSSSVNIWHMNEEEPIHTLANDSNIYSVVAMSSVMFLIGDRKGRIKSFKLVNNQWNAHRVFEDHTSGITSLTKINDTLFVSTSDDTTAKLWDISKPETCSLYTFRGHATIVLTSVYLEEEYQAIATGDYDGTIKIWAIEKFLKHGEHQTASEAILQPIQENEDRISTYQGSKSERGRTLDDLNDYTFNSGTSTGVEVQLENI